MADTATATTKPQTQSAKTAAKKRAGRPIYMVWRRVIDEATGELRLGLCADSGVDQFLCREREYRAGDVVRCEIKKARNIKFHRLVHALGGELQVSSTPGVGTRFWFEIDAPVCWPGILPSPSTAIRHGMAQAGLPRGSGLAPGQYRVTQGL